MIYKLFLAIPHHDDAKVRSPGSWVFRIEGSSSENWKTKLQRHTTKTRTLRNDCRHEEKKRDIVVNREILQKPIAPVNGVDPIKNPDPCGAGFFNGAHGQNRTGTPREEPRILSPVRLPIPPHEQYIRS